MMSSILTVLLLAAPGVEGASKSSFPAPKGAVAEATAILQRLVGEEAKETDQASRTKELAQAAKLLGKESPAGKLLPDALETANQRETVSRVVEMLSFKPIHEADLPAGFPTYTPVGAIEVKQYPPSRRAQADDFFTLFRHITNEQIAMTAPVRMEFEPDRDGEWKQLSMSFFYPGKAQGESTTEGGVTTVDDDGVLVVSVGCRGEMNDDNIEQARSNLADWLTAHPEFQKSGSTLVMGYNSPMAPKKSRFFEVQQPIVKSQRERQESEKK